MVNHTYDVVFANQVDKREASTSEHGRVNSVTIPTFAGAVARARGVSVDEVTKTGASVGNIPFILRITFSWDNMLRREVTIQESVNTLYFGMGDGADTLT